MLEATSIAQGRSELQSDYYKLQGRALTQSIRHDRSTLLRYCIQKIGCLRCSVPCPMVYYVRPSLLHSSSSQRGEKACRFYCFRKSTANHHGLLITVAGGCSQTVLPSLDLPSGLWLPPALHALTQPFLRPPALVPQSFASQLLRSSSCVASLVILGLLRS